MNQASVKSHTTHIVYKNLTLLTPKRMMEENYSYIQLGRNKDQKNYDGTWSQPRLRKPRHVSQRNSSHIHDSILFKKKPIFQPEPSLTHMKSELQKLSYR